MVYSFDFLIILQSGKTIDEKVVYRRMDHEAIASNTYSQSCRYGQKVASVHYIPVWCAGTTFCLADWISCTVFGAISSSSIWCPNVPYSMGITYLRIWSPCPSCRGRWLTVAQSPCQLPSHPAHTFIHTHQEFDMSEISENIATTNKERKKCFAKERCCERKKFAKEICCERNIL